MKWKVNLILFLLLAGGFLVISGLPSDLTVQSSSNLVEFVRPPVKQITWTLPEKIQAGQDLLVGSPALKFVEKKNGTLLRQEVALAVLDLQSGRVFEKRYWLEYQDIEGANRIRRLYLENPNNLPRFVPVEVSETLEVVVRWWNTFNSDLSIVDLGDASGQPNPLVVIGIKYLFSNSQLAYPEDQKGRKYSDIVYVPYSPEIHQPETIAKGFEFYNTEIDKAFEQLKTLGVKSLSYPGQLVVDTVDINFVKNLFLVEQIDPKMIFIAEDGGRFLAERVLVRLGVNGEKAFRYTFSKTGALGLGQIMPGTYGAIVKKYPDARLLKDVDIGRVEIKNAIIASILVLDEHLSIVLGKLKPNQKALLDKKIKSNPDYLNEIRAAAYNGGPGKYLAATATISLRVSETVQFVKKYKMVRDLRLFD